MEKSQTRHHHTHLHAHKILLRSHRICESQWPNVTFPFILNCDFYDAILFSLIIYRMSQRSTTYSASTKIVLARKQQQQHQKTLHLQIRANEHWFGAAKTKLNGATEQRERNVWRGHTTTTTLYSNNHSTNHSNNKCEMYAQWQYVCYQFFSRIWNWHSFFATYAEKKHTCARTQYVFIQLR